MRPHRDLAVLDAAEQVVTEIIALCERDRPRLLFKGQIQRSAQSVSANIGEAFGRATMPDRNRALVIARGEAEETIKHLRANFKSERIETKTYWRLHNRLVTIVKMLNKLLRSNLS